MDELIDMLYIGLNLSHEVAQALSQRAENNPWKFRLMLLEAEHNADALIGRIVFEETNGKNRIGHTDTLRVIVAFTWNGESVNWVDDGTEGVRFNFSRREG